MNVRSSQPQPFRMLLVVAFIATAVLLAAFPRGSVADGSSAGWPLAAVGLEAEQRAGEKIAASVTEALGPLAPVALSPFFALTCLSGASLLAEMNLPFLEGIKNNPILGTGSALNNGAVFAGLLVLTLLTAAPKFTKVTKPLAQAVDQIEAHAGIIAVIAVQFLSRLETGGESDATASIVLQAGIFSFTGDLLVAVFSAINIFVVNTVKFFFEVMVWLSPFPMVDAAFESANKAFAAGLVAIYVWSPWVATILNLLIFAICLLMFGWVYRRVIYMRCVLGDPLFGWFGERICRCKPVTLASTRLPSRIASQLPEATLVLKAFLGSACNGAARKCRGYLVVTPDRIVFARSRFLRSPVIVPLPAAGPHTLIDRGLLSNTIVFSEAEHTTAIRIIITRRYNALLDQIRACLGAPVAADAADATGATASDQRMVAASRAIGAAARTPTVRNELRTELS